MVDWPPTFRCNNNCISCICNLEMVEKFEPKDPQVKQIQRIIDAIKPEDILCLTGGEPTIRKEFFQFLEYAKKKDPYMNVFVVSNGRMFYYRDFVEKMAKVSPKNLTTGIALYGHNSKLHDSITRTPGSFDQTVKGVRNLIEFKVPVELRVIISKLNYKNLVDIARYVVSDLKGVYRMVFINMKYTGNAYKYRKSLFVRYRQVVPHAERATDLLLKNKIPVKLFHFPLCTIKAKYRELAKGVTKQKRELMFVDACDKCKVRGECPMIWKSYWVLAGER
ncbi:MAG: radical SAM protein [Candidatus Aenigmatarchaeota archaeon]|nr:MAG: radical SAM protein [Candidatus Aenigmarchaeota archaeon]